MSRPTDGVGHTSISVFETGPGCYVNYVGFG